MTYIGLGGVLLAVGVAAWLVSRNRLAAAQRSKAEAAKRARWARPLPADETQPGAKTRPRDFGRR
jgi:hypothetical protein